MREESIESVLARKGKIVTTPVGVSMRPMLKNRTDQIVIETLTRPPRPRDVVLFKRPNGQYVLHRVVKAEGDTFVIQGDNCTGEDRVKREQIIGILTGFYRGERYCDCEKSRGYRLYARLWPIVTFPRRALVKIKKQGFH